MAEGLAKEGDNRGDFAAARPETGDTNLLNDRLEVDMTLPG